jgi:hypothetical protein
MLVEVAILCSRVVIHGSCHLHWHSMLSPAVVPLCPLFCCYVEMMYCTISTLGSSILWFLVSKEAEKFSFNLWQILKVFFFSGCDLWQTYDTVLLATFCLVSDIAHSRTTYIASSTHYNNNDAILNPTWLQINYKICVLKPKCKEGDIQWHDKCDSMGGSWNEMHQTL